MRARSKTGGKRDALSRRKVVKPKRRNLSAHRTAAKREASVAQLKRELSETLRQQKGTLEVLRVISKSSGDLEPVFAAILSNAVSVGGADNGVINRWDGEALHLVATHNMPAAFTELRRRSPYRPDQHSASGRMLATKSLVHIADLALDQSYAERNPPTVAAVEIAGVRTTLAVPLLKENELVGSFTVGRNQVRPFSQRQIELITGFADQAVIAIENARLLHELRELVRQQTASGDVLNLISRSTFDLQGVLDTLIELAVRLCDADLAAMHRPQGADSRAIATYGGPPSHRDLAGGVPFEAGRGSVIGRSVLERRPIHVADVLADPDYLLQDAQQKIGYRTVLGVPLLREGNPIGVIVLMRLTVRPFSEKQIEFVQNFASQAVIAIENTRLLSELRQRTDELGRLVAELERERNNKLMTLEAMAASISHEVRQPLAGIASNGGAALRFLGHAPPNLDEARSALNGMVRDSHRASQVFDNIRALFGKADEGHKPFNINKLARDVLHTLRDELNKHGVTMRTALQSELPPITGHRGQLQEVFINLVRNAIEAMDAVKDGERTLQVTTKRRGDGIAVQVEDSGPGIDPRQMDSIFDAFITTKPNGMGLGLAICRMIIERHAGQLSVSAAHPRGSVFQIILPAERLGAGQPGTERPDTERAVRAGGERAGAEQAGAAG
ncbi:MAG TPA: GAF domain-containing sensor histidine kinase [Xanthobacteraceae bacterium]|jgi:signal transduction histidine kinase